MFKDPGRLFEDAGRLFEDAGRLFEDAGRLFEDAGVCLRMVAGADAVILKLFQYLDGMPGCK
jgi:hypothetical protein